MIDTVGRSGIADVERFFSRYAPCAEALRADSDSTVGVAGFANSLVVAGLVCFLISTQNTMGDSARGQPFFGCWAYLF